MKRKHCLTLLFFLVFLLSHISFGTFSCEESEYDAYSFVHISDTQEYMYGNEDIYAELADWTVRNRSAYNIVFLCHSGDIVDAANVPSQWESSLDARSILEDAGIPRMFVAGNHDLKANPDAFSQYYSADSYRNNFVEEMNFYYRAEAQTQIFKVPTGREWMFVGLQFNPSDDALNWAASQIEEHSECQVVIVTHDFLSSDGYPDVVGKRISDVLIAPYKNVSLVLCGHNHGSATNCTSYDDDGDGIPDRDVYALLADYQDEAGSGKIRLITVSEYTNEIFVETYVCNNGFSCSDRITIPW